MKRRHILISLLLACGIALLCGCAKASEKIIAEGTCGTCSWKISQAGRLTIRPTEGDEGTLELWETPEKIPWNDKRDKIRFCEFEGTIHARTCLSMFEECANLTEIDTAGLDISEVADMGKMFSGCKSIEYLDTSNWNTSHVANMEAMFCNCWSLRGIDVSRWDTSQVGSMKMAFDSCGNLVALDVSGWNTSKVKSMEFAFGSCAKLSELDVSKWDTSQLESMYYAFFGCTSLTSLDVSSWNTAQVAEGCGDGMVAHCNSLSTFTVGEKYEFLSEEMFPEGVGKDPKWRSAKDEQLYTRSEICSSRSGVADTYTCE